MKFNAVTENNGTFSVLNGTPRNTKKIAATRFSKVVGNNHWGDEFQAWCEIMRVAEPPFDGNKYTAAGQVIEPKLINFCKDSVSPYIVSPREYFEEIPRNFDFFPENPIFGGMWDALAFDHDGAKDGDGSKPIAVIECKTTSRPQDWEHGVPRHYMLQGLLYAALLDVDDVYFPVAFLTPLDYANPEDFECTDENTRVYHVSRDDYVDCEGCYLTVDEAMDYAKGWWKEFVEGNVSPEYDVKKDKEYLDIIRTVDMDETTIDAGDLNALLDALYEVDTIIEDLKVSSGLAEWEDKRRAINKAVQDLVKPQLLDTEDKNILDTNYYKFTISLTRRVNYDKMIEDGIYEKYVNEVPTIRTTMKKGE